MNKLYMVSKHGYPEDWVLIYTDTIENVIAAYCKEADIALLTVEAFNEGYNCSEINAIGGKIIKEIVFEN